MPIITQTILKNKITVVVTYYNKPRKIMLRCIESIEKLGLKYIIIDDASEMKGMEKELDNVIRLEENVGAYKAFEAGLKEVTTEYVMKVDADDYITGIPEVDTEHDAFINNTNGKVHFDLPKYINKPWAGLSGAVVRTEVMKAVWYTDLRRMGDLVIFCRLVDKYKCKLMDKDIYFYDRRHSEIARGASHTEDGQLARQVVMEMLYGKRQT